MVSVGLISATYVCSSSMLTAILPISFLDVTIYQRSTTYIMTNKNGMPRLMKGFYWEGCPPVDIADRFFHSIPLNLLRLMHVRLTQDIAEADKELLDALTKKGFRIDFNYDGSGFLMKAYERGGGYYLGTCTSP